jgi:TRAP-type mannitol/chloroaromatic compound transport system permease small subunit
VIPVMAILLAVQGVAIVLRCIAILRRPEEA